MTPSRRPFQLGAAPDFFFAGRPQRRALASLLEAFGRGERVVALTGAEGVGKTMLASYLGAELGQLAGALPGRTAPRLVVLDTAGQPDPARIGQQARLARRTLETEADTCLLVVGRALPPDILAELGLAEPPGVVLEPLEADEVGPFVRHRLERAASAGVPTFEATAYPAIHGWSAGLPRRIVRLCARLVALALAERRALITAAEVQGAVQELSLQPIQADVAPEPVAGNADIPRLRQELEGSVTELHRQQALAVATFRRAERTRDELHALEVLQLDRLADSFGTLRGPRDERPRRVEP